MFIVDVWYRCLQIGHSVHAPGFLEPKDSARDYCTRHHRSGNELRIARLGRPRYPRGHLAVGVYEEDRSTRTPKPCRKAKESSTPPGFPRDLHNDDLVSVAAQYCLKEAKAHQARPRIPVPDDI
jgi:hypothetical protein